METSPPESRLTGNPHISTAWLDAQSYTQGTRKHLSDASKIWRRVFLLDISSFLPLFSLDCGRGRRLFFVIAGLHLAIDCTYRVALRQRRVNGFSVFRRRILCFSWIKLCIFVHVDNSPYDIRIVLCIIHPCFVSFVLVVCPIFGSFNRCNFLSLPYTIVSLVYIFNDMPSIFRLRLQPFRDNARIWYPVFVRFDTCVSLSNHVQLSV